MNLVHRVAGVVAGAVIAVGAACLPLPPAVTTAVCPSRATYAPPLPADAPTVMFPTDAVSFWQQRIPEANAALMERVTTFPGRFSVSASPIVTVRLADLSQESRDTAAALRREFGNSIDIEMGWKRLAGGPSGATAACIVSAPRWAIGQAAPKGVVVTVTPRAAPLTRDVPVSADVTVVNRTRKTIHIGPLAGRFGRGCHAPYLFQPISRIDSALAANVSVGTLAPGEVSGESPLGGQGFVRTAVEGAPTWRPMTFTCEGTMVAPSPILPGATVTFPVTASTISLSPGDDPALEPGPYDLRVLLAMTPFDPKLPAGSRPTTSASGPLPAGWRIVAAPPTRIELVG